MKNASGGKTAPNPAHNVTDLEKPFKNTGKGFNNEKPVHVDKQLLVADNKRKQKVAKNHQNYSSTGSTHSKESYGPPENSSEFSDLTPRDVYHREPKIDVKLVNTARSVVQVPVKHRNSIFEKGVKFSLFDFEIRFINSTEIAIAMFSMMCVFYTFYHIHCYGVSVHFNACTVLWFTACVAAFHCNRMSLEEVEFPVIREHDEANTLIVYKRLQSSSWFRKIGYMSVYSGEIYSNLRDLLVKKYLQSKLTTFTTLQMTRDCYENLPEKYIANLDVLRNTISVAVSDIEVFHARNSVDLMLNQATIPNMTTL